MKVMVWRMFFWQWYFCTVDKWSSAHGPLGVTSISTVEAVLYPVGYRTALTVLMLVIPRGPWLGSTWSAYSRSGAEVHFEFFMP